MFRKTVAVVVALGCAFGSGTVAVAQYSQPGAKSEAPKSGTTQTADATKPAENATKSAEKVSTVSGKVKSVTGTSLVVEVRGKTSKEYTFDLAGTTIKAGGKNATATDLKDGDDVGVSYTQSEGKLIAKTITARAIKPKK
jgi:ribosomal protein S1